MFDHFGRRLQRDLKGIVDERILSSETKSGSLMKVCFTLLYRDLHHFADISNFSDSLPESTSTLSRTRSKGELSLASVYTQS